MNVVIAAMNVVLTALKRTSFSKIYFQNQVNNKILLLSDVVVTFTPCFIPSSSSDHDNNQKRDVTACVIAHCTCTRK